MAGFELRRCAECHLVYVWPRPDRDASASSYAAGHRGDTTAGEPAADTSSLLAQYDAEHSPYVRLGLCNRLLRLQRRRPLARMLDFGCGSGHLLGLARETLGTSTFGIELHPVAQAGSQRFGFTLHQGTLETAPFDPGSFDLVYSVQVFEHLPAPRLELARLVKLLAPGGLLYLEVPHDGSLAIRLGRDEFLHNRPPGHLNFFTRPAMRRLLRDAGLEVLALRTTGLDHRSLFGRPPRAGGAAGQVTGAGGAEGSRRDELPRPGQRLRLRLAGAVDGLLTLPGWGMQLEAIARRPG